jgi:hypothetical protein
MPDVRSVERRLGDAADGEHAAATCELAGERQARLDLRTRRRSVRGGGAGMRRDDVPEEDGVRKLELGKYAVASPGGCPVSCRSDVKGMPETRAPRYPAASPTSSSGASARASR